MSYDTNGPSPACDKGGSGECDGYFPDGRECACTCHELEMTPETTVDDIAAWHREVNGEAPRYFRLSLPCAVIVRPDGTVHIRPDLDEADDLDEGVNEGMPYPEEVTRESSKAVESAILARTVTLLLPWAADTAPADPTARLSDPTDPTTATALMGEARRLRVLAGSRKMAGPALAATRADLRADARRMEEMAQLKSAPRF